MSQAYRCAHRSRERGSHRRCDGVASAWLSVTLGIANQGGTEERTWQSGQLGRSRGQGYQASCTPPKSNSPSRTPSRNACHFIIENTNSGPCGSSEFRTATAPPRTATSTQPFTPLCELLRHAARERSIVHRPGCFREGPRPDSPVCIVVARLAYPGIRSLACTVAFLSHLPIQMGLMARGARVID